MLSTKRLLTPEARARLHLKLDSNTILATMQHGSSILTATISRSFIKARGLEQRENCRAGPTVPAPTKNKYQRKGPFACVVSKARGATENILYRFCTESVILMLLMTLATL